MGHKVHPKVFRLGTTTTWPSRWFARDDVYRAQLREDLSIRDFFKRELKDASVSEVSIERSRGALAVTIASGKPGTYLGVDQPRSPRPR
jgi:small subunit ribosomal protein S3